MTEYLVGLDRELLLLLNGSDSTYWDNVMMTVTRTSAWWLLIVALLIVLVRNNSRERLFLAILGIALTILVADQFSSSFCKPFFHRLRPSHEPWFGDAVDIVNGYRSGLYGFISSHAANTFGVAMFVSCVVRQRSLGLMLFFWASLASYSRIYLGVHYPGDILCGALWGLLAGWCIYRLYVWACGRIDGRRSFYSSRYTPSGYLIDDVHWLEVAFLATYLYVLVRACL